jgi:hypothetical protein
MQRWESRTNEREKRYDGQGQAAVDDACCEVTVPPGSVRQIKIRAIRNKFKIIIRKEEKHGKINDLYF